MTTQRPCVFCDLLTAALCPEEAFVTGAAMGIVACESAPPHHAGHHLRDTMCTRHQDSFDEHCASANIAMRAVRS